MTIFYGIHTEKQPTTHLIRQNIQLYINSILSKFERFFKSIHAMCRRLLTFVLIFALNPLHAQDGENLISRLKNKFFGTETDSTKNGSFIAVPALGYAQETGLEYGLASTYSFFVDKRDPQRRSSNISFSATLTAKMQKNIKLSGDIWTRDNQYHIISEVRYRDWPFNFYGIGNSTLAADKDYLGQRLTRAKIDVERKITNKLYLGLNAQFDHFQFEDIEAGGIYEQSSMYGRNGGKYIALGGSALFDNRDHTTYSTRGTYFRARYAHAPKFWGGENFSGGILELDARAFYSPLSTVTLAAQGIYRATFAEHTPFYMYRELGGDTSMRGYYLGRYRDNNYTALQSELRYRPIPRLGAAIFGSVGSTFSEQHPYRTITSYGAGVRYFFSLEHSSSIRFDYAIGEKRPGEKRQTGFYLSLSEAF